MPAFINSVGFKPRLNEVKASGGDIHFKRKFIVASFQVLSVRKYAEAHLIHDPLEIKQRVANGYPLFVFFILPIGKNHAKCMSNG